MLKYPSNFLLLSIEKKLYDTDTNKKDYQYVFFKSLSCFHCFERYLDVHCSQIYVSNFNKEQMVFLRRNCYIYLCSTVQCTAFYFCALWELLVSLTRIKRTAVFFFLMGVARIYDLHISYKVLC